MFGSSATYPRRSAGVLARPRLGPLKSYLKPRNFPASPTVHDNMPARTRKGKGRKSNGSQKMDPIKKRTPDYTDIAYREAVSRLRYLLAESYSPYASRNNLHQVQISKIEESGDETEGSVAVSERYRSSPIKYRTPATLYNSKRPAYDAVARPTHASSTLHVPGSLEREGPGLVAKSGEGLPPPELMAFIERQEDYIEQLEKESQYCRDELSNLLGKVKEVISENEGLHEKEKSGLLKSVFNCFESEDEENLDIDDGNVQERKPTKMKKKRLEGPSIVFESRISELEAQLTQTRIDLRKALEEAELYKKKLNEGHSLVPTEGFSSLPSINDHSLKQQVEALQREKHELNDTLSKLQSALAQFRDKEADASHKAKRSLDVVDQAQFEKQQSDVEVRRLKDELDRQHEKLRELLQEQGRKLQDERSQTERRYAQQVEQLTSDLTLQWDLTSKLQLEIEKQRRMESELRRDGQQKSIAIDDLKKELQIKIAALQGEIMQAAGEKGSLEQELSSSRLTVERTERESRQEISRLQAEVSALRQRLDRADADLLHSRRENLRLAEQVSSLEREVSLGKMMRENMEKNASDGFTPNSPSKSALREHEISAMIHDMEAKHVQTVAELEGMILSQNDVMRSLKDECHALTERLEDSSARHKGEKASFRSENAQLMEKLSQVWETCKDLQIQCGVNSQISAENDYQVTTHMLGNQSPNPNTNNLPNQNSLTPNPNLRRTPSPNYRCIQSPNPTYKPTTSPSPTYKPTTSPSPTYKPTTSPSPTYKPTTSPSPTYKPTTSLSPTYKPTTSPSPTYKPTTSLSPTCKPTTSPNRNLAMYRSPPNLSPRRREGYRSDPPLTLEDLATDSDSSES